MRCYEQLCGLALAMDVVGERWTVLVVRELILGPRRFTDLAASLDGITPNLLSRRLAEMEGSGLIRRAQGDRARGYELTPLGRELVPALQMLSRWGASFVTPERVASYRKSARWMMTSLLWRMQPTGHDWELVVAVDGSEYTIWERDGACNVAASASPTTADVLHVTQEELRMLLFQSKRPSGARGKLPGVGRLLAALASAPRRPR